MDANNRHYTARRTLRAALLWLPLFVAGHMSAQELVVSTGNAPPFGPGPLIAIGDFAHELPSPTLHIVAPIYAADLPAVNPHGFAMLDRDTAVANNITTASIVDVFDLPTGTLTAAFHPNDAYSVGGTVAIDPGRSHVLLTSATGALGDAKLYVVPMPLSSTSVATSAITLPGTVDRFQTHAITFDESGRAFIGHKGGITAIGPPYDSTDILFTIDLSPDGNSYAIELSPDESTLLASNGVALTIVHAPFSSSSAHEDLVLPDAVRPDAPAFVPDGSKALVVDDDNTSALGPRLYAISAPFSSASIVETLPIPAELTLEGFEDLAISPDGEFAVLTGQSLASEPLIVVRAPFTASGYSFSAIPIPYIGAPFGPSGRGDGTAHFWSSAGALPPQVTIDPTSVIEGNGESRTAHFVVHLTRATSQTVTVDYTTQNVTAQADVDYLAASGTLTIPAGARSAEFDVSVIGNTVDDPQDKFFDVVLSHPVNAALRQLIPAGDGVATIIDDDGPMIVTDPPLPGAIVGVPYTATLEVANFISLVTTHAERLPDGLFITISGPTTLTIAGTPSRPTIPQDVSRFVRVVVEGSSFQGASRVYELVVSGDVIFANGFDR